MGAHWFPTKGIRRKDATAKQQKDSAGTQSSTGVTDSIAAAAAAAEDLEIYKELRRQTL